MKDVLISAAITVTLIGLYVTFIHTPTLSHDQHLLDEWRVRYDELQKQHLFLEKWKACVEAHGELIVDAKGNAACALRKDRWGVQ